MADYNSDPIAPDSVQKAYQAQLAAQSPAPSPTNSDEIAPPEIQAAYQAQLAQQRGVAPAQPAPPAPAQNTDAVAPPKIQLSYMLDGKTPDQLAALIQDPSSTFDPIQVAAQYDKDLTPEQRQKLQETHDIDTMSNWTPGGLWKAAKNVGGGLIQMAKGAGELGLHEARIVAGTGANSGLGGTFTMENGKAVYHDPRNDPDFQAKQKQAQAERDQAIAEMGAGFEQAALGVAEGVRGSTRFAAQHPDFAARAMGSLPIVPLPSKVPINADVMNPSTFLQPLDSSQRFENAVALAKQHNAISEGLGAAAPAWTSAIDLGTGGRLLEGDEGADNTLASALATEGVKIRPDVVQQLSTVEDPTMVGPAVFGALKGIVGAGKAVTIVNGAGRVVAQAASDAAAKQFIDKVGSAISGAGEKVTAAADKVSTLKASGAGAVLGMIGGHPAAGAAAAGTGTLIAKGAGKIITFAGDKLADSKLAVPLLQYSKGVAESAASGGVFGAGMAATADTPQEQENAVVGGAALGGAAGAVAAPLAAAHFKALGAAEKVAGMAFTGADVRDTPEHPGYGDADEPARQQAMDELKAQDLPTWNLANRMMTFVGQHGGKLKVLTPDEMANALNDLQIDSPSGKPWSGDDDLLPRGYQVGSTALITLTHDASGKIDSNALFHEPGHILTESLPAKTQDALFSAIRDTYSPEQIDAFKQSYEKALRVSGLSDAAINHELAAELFAGVLRGIPLDGTPLPLRSKISAIVGPTLEAIGLVKPQIGENGAYGNALGVQNSPTLSNFLRDYAQNPTRPPVLPGSREAAPAPAAPEVRQNVLTPAHEQVVNKLKAAQPEAAADIAQVRAKVAAGQLLTAQEQDFWDNVDDTAKLIKAPAAPAPAAPAPVAPTPEPLATAPIAPKPTLANVEVEPTAPTEPTATGPGLRGKLGEIVPVAEPKLRPDLEAAVGTARQAIAADPELTSDHKENFEKVVTALTADQGQVKPLLITRDAAEGDAANRTSRREEVEAARGSTGEGLQSVQSVIIPSTVQTTKAGKVQVIGFDPERVFANAEKLATGAEQKKVTDLIPYPTAGGKFTPEGAAAFRADLEGYLQNHAAGYTGAGEPLVHPENYDGFLNPVKTDYKPVTLDKAKADFINAALGVAPPKTVRPSKGLAGEIVRPLNIRAGDIAAINKRPGMEPGVIRPKDADKQIYHDFGDRSITEFNPLRKKLDLAGVDTRELEEVNVRIPLDRIHDVQPTNSKLRAPVTDATAAGFLPAEKEVQFKRDEPMEGSVGKKVLDLVHYSSRGDLTELKKDFFGKGAATPNDHRGAKKIFTFVSGSKTGADSKLTNGRYVYGAKVDGSSIYDMAQDPLGLSDMINVEKRDNTLIQKGYAGFYVPTYDGRKVVALFNPLKVDKLGRSETEVKRAGAKIKTLRYLPPDLQTDKTKTGQAFADFFSRVTKGQFGKSEIPFQPELDLGDAIPFLHESANHTGNFDEHIAKSIPTFKEMQMRKGEAIVKTFGAGAHMLDIGASEGSLAKTITSRSLGKIKTVALDPNPDMAKFFNEKSHVEGSSYDTSAFREGFQDGDNVVPAYKPKQRFDVVHESMVFQFISNEREQQVAEAKRLMKPDGVFLTEEKLRNGNWAANEAFKDANHKDKYFSKAELAAKDKVVGFQQSKQEAKAVGMVDNMVSADKLEDLLTQNFKHVVQYWDSGNFRGYAASDSLPKLQELVHNMGDVNSKFSTVQTPRAVTPGAHFLPADEKDPVWYSRLQRTLEAKMPQQATLEQVRGILANHGSQEDERNWGRWDDFMLDHVLSGKPTIDKAELLAHLRANEPKLSEIVKGLKEFGELETLPDRFLTEKVSQHGTSGWGVRDALGKLHDGQHFVWDSRSRKAAQTAAIHWLNDLSGDAKFERYQLPGGENYREMLLTLPPGGAQDGKFRSNHWYEPNVVAHTRVNDRVDSDGKPGLFAEELQSDWHQKGRKNGYQGDHSDTAGPDSDKVPDAPYRTTWHEMLFRRLLREAVDHGKEWLGWTTGEQQAERYADLKVGGEGMKGFYDKILVDYANKIGKKFGVKVTDRKLSNRETFDEWLDRTDPPRASQYALSRLEEEYNRGSETVHSLDITPEMAASIKGGQPRFLPAEKERVTAAAWRDPDTGEVHTGPFHGHIYERLGMSPLAGQDDFRIGAGEGFQTNLRPFVDRDEAERIGKAAGQIEGTGAGAAAEDFDNFEGGAFLPAKKNEPERIKAAAIRFPDGKVFSGPTHSSILAKLAEKEDRIFETNTQDFVDEDGDQNWENGFLTNKNRFVDREEAYRIGRAAQQVDESENKSLDALDLKKGPRFLPAEKQSVEIEGPDGTRYPATFDGHQDFSALGRGKVPQFTAQADIPGVVTKGSTTYGPALERKGYKLPTLGQFLPAEEQTKTEGFKKWFGDWEDPKAFSSRRDPSKPPVSTVVGPDGKPLVVYHSTPEEFNTFETGRTTQNSNVFGSYESSRHAIFATPNQEFSRSYAPKGNVMPLFMDIKSPFDLRKGFTEDQLDELKTQGLNPRYYRNLPASELWEIFDGEGGKEFVSALKKLGYDGAVFHEPDDSREPQTTYAAFDPNQVKSASSNSGAFDSKNPDIRYLPADTAPGRLGTRNPTAKSATEDASKDQTVVDVDSMARNKAAINRAASLVRRYYPQIAAEIPKGAKPAQVVDTMRNHIASNIEWLYDQVPPEVREQSKRWYDGATKLATDWAKEFGVSKETVSTVIAALSPQRDWYQNVSFARKALMIVKQTPNGGRWTPEMDKVTRGWINGTPESGSKSLMAPKTKALLADSLADMRDKKFQDLNLFQKAVWMRAYSDAHLPKTYPVLGPEGNEMGQATTAKGTGSKLQFPGFVTLENAITVIEDPSAKNRSDVLGGAHKVRNFYNNILNPNDPKYGDVTIDTHAVAGGLVAPMGGTDREVLHNFGSPLKGEGGPVNDSVIGIEGLYPIYADAFRQAAKAKGVLPREIQSITWEAARGLFTPGFKRGDKEGAEANNINLVKQAWQRYAEGKETLDETRNKIAELAGGIRNPVWYGQRSGNAPARQTAANLGELPITQLPRQGLSAGSGGDFPTPARAAKGGLGEASELAGTGRGVGQFLPADTKSPQFKRWFRFSKIKNDDGSPKVVYHSTTAKDDFNVFEPGDDDLGMHFGTVGQAADLFDYRRRTVKNSGKTYPVYLSIKRPLRMVDMGYWDASRIVHQLQGMYDFSDKEIDKAAAKPEALTSLRSLIESKGYDGIVYKNKYESIGGPELRAAAAKFKAEHSPFTPADRAEYKRLKAAIDENISRNGEDSYIVFHPEQIKSAIGNSGAFDRKNPDIRALPAAAPEVAPAQKPDWSDVPIRGVRPTLAGVPIQQQQKN